MTWSLPEIQKLLADPGAEAEQPCLTPVGFSDPEAAVQGLRRLQSLDPRGRAFPALLPLLLTALSHAAHPNQALINLENLLQGQPAPVETLTFLATERRLLEVLIQLFAGSEFLASVLLKNPGYINDLRYPNRLARPRTETVLRQEALKAAREGEDWAGKTDRLRDFQRRELLRIGTADLLGILDFGSVTRRLSDLATALIKVVLQLGRESLNLPPEGFCILAFGKLGGRELNYSSDIDLVFVCEKDPDAQLPLARKIIDGLASTSGAGFLYRVDMRLRPWGKTGQLVPPRELYVKYLHEEARLWEKQALLKMRFVGGDEQLAISFIREAGLVVRNLETGQLQGAVLEMKDAIESNLRRKGTMWGEVKSGSGSIRDVEFVTQYLQLRHGRQKPEVLSRNTLDALSRLRLAGFLSQSDYQTLSEGYTFLRSVEHLLQILHNRQIHQMPADVREQGYLARRLGFEEADSAAAFIEGYQHHSQAIRRVFETHLHPEGARSEAEETEAPSLSQHEHHLRRMTRAYAISFSEITIARHSRMADELTPRTPLKMETRDLGNHTWELTLVAYDYLGELAAICGLLLVYGLDILEGNIFTYRPERSKSPSSAPRTARFGKARFQPVDRQKIVDVFRVRTLDGSAPDWNAYRKELEGIIAMLHKREQRQVYGLMARRVAGVLSNFPQPGGSLLPMDIEIDNTVSQNATVLRIDAQDTPGFLYTFASALALNDIYISGVSVSSLGNRIHDTLFITDTRQQKITDPQRQRQLRAAVLLVKHFTNLLPQSPNAESALLHFRDFVDQFFRHGDWENELATLEQPGVLDALSRLLGVSDFLWDDFLRMQHQNLLPIIRDLEGLDTIKSREQLQEELRGLVEGLARFEDWREALNRFKDREMFRIDMRFILGRIPKFWLFSAELSDLAEAVVGETVDRAIRDIRQAPGDLPEMAPDNIMLAVAALGKLGGRGIGFGSDIELMFIYREPDKAGREGRQGLARFYDRIVQQVLKSVEARQNGIFEIDLRLRPYGKAGPLAVSFSQFEQYFGPEGAAWNYERQALVKLRPIYGPAAFGEQILASRDRIIYSGSGFDTIAMRALRERQVRQLVRGGTVNVKFSPGALVDLEYTVQGLQIIHGHLAPQLRRPSTGQALAALARHGILDQNDFGKLREAHSLLRRVIEGLRMVRGNARDLTLPPADSREFAFLARRLGYGSDASRLWNDILATTHNVLEISLRLLPQSGE
ncbi:MAG: glutamine synthetase adenylyltransferase [Calditrichaeota bacterium]|nr:glutamine synthetase adenylyltransferase [Calditrichota bacterium]